MKRGCEGGVQGQHEFSEEASSHFLWIQICAGLLKPEPHWREMFIH